GYHRLTRKTFTEELQKQNVSTVFRVNEQGFIYGVTFIDNLNKTVFNGSDLGKAYGAKAILARLDTMDKPNALQQTLKREPTAYRPPQKVNDGRLSERISRIHFKATNNQAEVAPIVTRKKKKRRNQSQEHSL
ncbi:MAG: relaxase, partial [Bacteroidetes bacterium]|nr:relaxase [Bacteroidota bacterium]